MTDNALKASAWYGESFKHWGVKTHGPKPEAALLDVAHVFGRPGKQSLALAMALRPDGVTGSQIMFACDGKPQNNHRRGLIEAGLLKRVQPYQGTDGHTVYKCELTAKGVKRVEAAKAKAAEAATKGEADGSKPAKAKRKAASKAKGERKPRQPKVTPKAETPTGEAGTGTDSPLPPVTGHEGEPKPLAV